jgi:hypothetical protein
MVPHIDFLLLKCIQSKNLALLRSAEELIKDGMKYFAFSSNFSYLPSVLKLCEVSNDANGASPEGHDTYFFVGLSMLTNLLVVLQNSPSTFQIYFDRICDTIFSGIAKYGANRHCTDQIRESFSTVLQRSLALYTEVKSMEPSSNITLCWKALHCVCTTASTTSIATIHTIVNNMGIAWSSRCIKIASEMSIQTLTIITKTFEETGEQEYLVENSLLSLLVGQFKAETRVPKDLERVAEQDVNDQNAIQPPKHNLVRSDPEQHRNSPQVSLHAAAEVLRILQMRGINDHYEGEQSQEFPSKSISPDSWISIMKSLLHLISQFVDMNQRSMSKLSFPNLEKGGQPFAAAIESIRTLPSSSTTYELLTSDFHVEPAEFANPERNISFYEADNSSMYAVISAVYDLVESFSVSCTPLGLNFALLWDQLLDAIVDIELQTAIIGSSSNYHKSAYRTHALYLCQIILQFIPLSVPSIELSTACGTSSAKQYLEKSIVSTKSWEILHRWLGEASCWDEWRNVILVILKVFGAAQPMVEALLHYTSAKTCNDTTSENLYSPTAKSFVSRFSFAFVPFSLRQMYFLHSVLFDSMEVTGRGLTSFRVLSWSRLLYVWLHLYREHAFLLSLPMAVTLLQSLDRDWEYELSIIEQQQHHEHQQYVRAFIIHYFHLVADVFQIPSLVTLLRDWYYQQHHLKNMTRLLPTNLKVDFERGSLDWHRPVNPTDSYSNGNNHASSSSFNATAIKLILVAHNRFQPIQWYINQSFLHPFRAFNEEYIVQMMSTPAFVSHSENTTPQSALIVSQNRHLSLDVKEEDNAQPSNPGTLVVVNANLESFAVKPRLWRDAFLKEVAEMEQLQSLDDVVKYMDLRAKEADEGKGAMIRKGSQFPAHKQEELSLEKSAPEETINDSLASLLPSLF